MYVINCAKIAELTAMEKGYSFNARKTKARFVAEGVRQMKTPSTAEILRDEARRSERLRITLMALDCKDLDEFINKLRAEDKN